MIFPKDTALSVGFKTQEQAIEWACKKHSFGGCFEFEKEFFNDKGEQLFLAYWLPSNHPQLANFAW
jgi:hypothetical protein